MRWYGFVAVVLLAMSSTGAWSAPADVSQDPYFGEALYHAYQGDYFDALERLDTELAQHRRLDQPDLDSFYKHVDFAEFSVGDFELNYRMHLRAGRAITAVLEADVPDPVRNEAAYRLARIHFQKGQKDEALRVIRSIRGEAHESVRDQAAFLEANILMAMGEAEEAVEVLRKLQGSRELRGFTSYNLGIALLRADDPVRAIAQLDKAGRERADGRELLAIRDQANLVLGTLLFEASEFEHAQRSLDRVRLQGPFSNRALLGAGWAEASSRDYERALVPWSILAKRDSTDAAVQEVLLALPFAYSKLDVHGRAALLFEDAVGRYGNELDKIDASIGSVREGRFLEALAREEIKQDQDWVVQLRELPDAPETFYLVDLMASHDFQTALQNYLDLEDLKRRLIRWKVGLDSFDELAELRRTYYKPLLPGLDARFRKLDARIRLRLEQRDQLERRIAHLLIDPDPRQLATANERILASKLDRLDAAVGQAPGAEGDRNRARIARLRGRLLWNLEENYHQRLTDAHVHLTELSEEVERMTARYDAFVRARQAATHSYVGYPARIASLRGRISRSMAQCIREHQRQGQTLEKIAIRELLARRNRLEDYQNRARFAFADSYDRAVKAQARVH